MNPDDGKINGGSNTAGNFWLGDMISFLTLPHSSPSQSQLKIKEKQMEAVSLKTGKLEFFQMGLILSVL